MGTDPTHEELMAYLYGELSEDENRQIEGWLKEHPDTMKEINELKDVRGVMSELEDKEIIDPFFYTGKSSFSVFQIARVINKTIIKPVIGLAAAISLLVLTGYLTDFNLNTEQGYLNISFSKTVSGKIDSDQIGKIVKQVLTEENVMLKSDIETLENKMNIQLASYYENQDKKYDAEQNNSNESGLAMAEIVKQMQKDNLEYLERYMKISTSNQEQYLQTALRDFSEYLGAQREEDLVRIQYNLTTLKETQDIQKMETDQILATILNTVKTENKY